MQLKEAVQQHCTVARVFKEQLGKLWSSCAVLAARQQLEACLENPDTRQLKEAIDAAEPFKERLGELWSTAQSGILFEAFVLVLICVSVSNAADRGRSVAEQHTGKTAYIPTEHSAGGSTESWQDVCAESSSKGSL